MPNLPDLKAKVKLDWSELDTAALKAKALGSVLQAELGGSRSAEIDRSMKNIGASLEDTGRKASNAGTAFIKWGDNGQVASLRISSATARSKGDFDELERRTRALGDSLERDFRKGTSAVVRLSEEGGASLSNVNRQMAATATSGTQAAGGLLSMGTAGVVLIGVGVALALALAPLVITLGAFALGLAAVLTVMALAGAAVLGLAAGIVVLAVATQGWMSATIPVPQAQAAVANATNAHTAAVNALATQQTAYNATSTHTAQQTLALQVARQNVTDTTLKLTKAQQDLTAAETGAHNPLQQLKDDAKAMAETLGAQAAPMAGLLLGWIDKLIPQVQELGQSLLTWFGARLPGILRGASDVAVQLFGALGGLGEVFGRFLDQAGARAPEFTTLFGQTLGFAVDAIDGLLQNLLRLSDWFIARLPTYGPVVAAVFSFIGSTVQFLGRVFGAIADWFVAAWPSVISAVQGLWAAIVQGWSFAGPVLDQVRGALATMGPTFQFIRDHAENLKPVLVAVGVVVVVLIAALAGVAVVVYTVVLALVALATGLTWFVNWVKSQLPEAGAQFSALGTTAQAAVGLVGSAFSAAGTFVSTAIGQYQQASRDIGSAFSAIGSGIQARLSAVGGFFSAIGSAAQGAAQAIGGFFSGVLSVVTTIGNLIAAATNLISQIFLTVFAIWLGLWIAIFQRIQEIVSPPLLAVAGFISGVWNGILAVASAVWGAITSTISTFLQLEWAGIQIVWNAISGFLSGVWSAISGAASAAWSAITSLIGRFLQLEYDGIMVIWNAVHAFLVGLWNGIQAVANTVWSAISGLIGRLNTGTSTTLQDIWNRLHAWLSDRWNQIGSTANAAWTNIHRFITDWVGRIRDSVQGVWNGMVAAAERFGGDLAAKIRSGVHSVVDVLNIFIDKANSALHPLLGHDVVGRLSVQGLAAGGAVDYHRAGTGFLADRPTILVGEGRGREWVIPEDPAHRGNALALLNQASRALGYIGLQAGGILDWLPNAGPMVQGPTGGFTHAAILAATGGRAWDYMAPNNSPVFAGVPGTVLGGPGGGYGVSISFNMDAGGSVILGHLARILAAGHVNKGQQIALSDNTGFSTGPHLHFEVRGSAMSPGPGGGGFDIHALIQAALSPLTAAAHLAANLISPDWIKQIANAIIDKVAGSLSAMGGGTPPSSAPKPIPAWTPGHGFPTAAQGLLPAPPDGFVYDENANLIPRITTGPMVQAEDGSWVPASYYTPRASGGPVLPGRLYTVGERGPELFSPSTPGTIIPGGLAGSDRTGELIGVLSSIDRRLAAIQGADSVSTRTAARAF